MRVKVNFFHIEYPVVPASIVEKTIFSPLNYLTWHLCQKLSDHVSVGLFLETVK